MGTTPRRGGQGVRAVPAESGAAPTRRSAEWVRRDCTRIRVSALSAPPLRGPAARRGRMRAQTPPGELVQEPAGDARGDDGPAVQHEPGSSAAHAASSGLAGRRRPGVESPWAYGSTRSPRLEGCANGGTSTSTTRDPCSPRRAGANDRATRPVPPRERGRNPDCELSVFPRRAGCSS